MADYKKLVKALRCCAENFGCPIECPRYSPADEGVRACVSRLEKDAAAAIEELQAEVKRLELENEDYEYTLRERYDEPKLGEWIEMQHGDEVVPSLCKCSVCGSTWLGVGGYNYCPSCGAKMGGTDEQRT